MDYQWDEEKNQANYEKHAVWFEEAQTVWGDPYALEFFDPEHSIKEDRFLKIGTSTRQRTLFIVFCERDGDKIRIISARKCTKKEREFYEKRI